MKKDLTESQKELKCLISTDDSLIYQENQRFY